TTSGTGSFTDLSKAPTTTGNIASGTSSIGFKYTDTAAGSPKITASPPGSSTLTPATQTETVTPSGRFDRILSTDLHRLPEKLIAAGRQPVADHQGARGDHAGIH